MQDASAMPKPGRPTVLLLVLICAAGAVLRFVWLDNEGFWLDEMFTGKVVMRRGEGIFGILDNALHGDIHPPLYYLLISGWAALFGDSELALRSFSAIAGALAAPLALVMLRRHLAPSGLVVLALLFVSSPLLLEPSQQARTYPLLILVATAATALLLDLVTAPGWHGAARRRLAWLTAVLLVGCWLHYFMLNLALAAGIVLLWRWRRERPALRDIAIAGLAGLALLLPWLVPHAVIQRENLGPGAFWIGTDPSWSLKRLFAGLLGSPWSPLWPAGLLGLPAAALLLPWRRVTAGDRTRLAVLGGVAAAMLIIAVSAGFALPSLTSRTIAAFGPPLLAIPALLAPYGFGQSSPVRRYGFAIALALAMVMPASDAVRLASKHRFPQWRESAALVFAWPGCRDAEIATWHLHNAMPYYRERFAPGASAHGIELTYGDPAALYRNRVRDADCPVMLWADAPKLRHTGVVRMIEAEEGPLQHVRFRKILLLIRPDAEWPPGYERD